MKKYTLLLALIVSINGFSQLTNNGVTIVSENTEISFPDAVINSNGATFVNKGAMQLNNNFTNHGTFEIIPSSSTIINGNDTISGILEVTINGSVAGEILGYSQVNVNGNLILTSPILNIMIDPAYLPADGASHTIITYTGTLSGTFATVNIISTSGWFIDYSTSGEVNVVRDSVLNIEDINETDLTVYPNPATDYININSSIEIDKIELFDLLGKLVLSTNQTSEINVSHLPIGVYLLRIISEKGRIAKKIIIK